MPSSNPRVALTVDPHRYDLLTRLAKLQGTSRAAIVTETMELIYPVLERVCVVLEAASKAQESSKEGLRHAVAKAEAQLSPLLYEVASQFDLFIDQAEHGLGAEGSTKARDAIFAIMNGEGKSAGGTVERRSRADGPPPAPHPRTSDTGVRLPKSVDNSVKRRRGKS